LSKDKFIARVQSTANGKSSVSLNVAEKMALCLLSWMSVVMSEGNLPTVFATKVKAGPTGLSNWLCVPKTLSELMT
jgi:hypothetical protein